MTDESSFLIRRNGTSDKDWIKQFMLDHWFSEQIIVHNTFFSPANLPGFTAEKNGEILGLVTYHIQQPVCEIISLDSLYHGRGIGSALLRAVKESIGHDGCTCLRVITTNDNLTALGFYQKFGFHLVALCPDAVTEARKVKPTIPFNGENGIPLRDEIVLEMNVG